MSFALFFCVLVISGSFLGSTAMKLVVTQQSSGETKRHNNKQQTTSAIKRNNNTHTAIKRRDWSFLISFSTGK